MDQKEINSENIVLLQDKIIYKHKSSIFNIYTKKEFVNDWLALFSGKLDPATYEKVFIKLKSSARDEIYFDTLQGREIKENFQRDSRCISGSVIEGNQMVPIDTNEFITIETRETITLRWYYDSKNCTLIEKFAPITVSQTKLKELLKN